MPNDRNEGTTPESQQSSTSAEKASAEPLTLLVLLERQSAELLKALADSVDQPWETTACALVQKGLDMPESSELFEASSPRGEDGGPASIPTTSEIYLASFQDETREELWLSFGSTVQQRIGALTVQHRLPPGRVVELLLEAGLQRGSHALVAEDFHPEPTSSGGLLASLRKKLGL